LRVLFLSLALCRLLAMTRSQLAALMRLQHRLAACPPFVAHVSPDVKDVTPSSSAFP
jgi:hypothetical protein